jgi:UDP-2,4-diacetamido-2,4,6-trideoxy-beta-L-altropyranose hydrolase
LADELKARGHRILIVSRAEPGHLIELVRERGYDCADLPPGIDALEDARLTAAVITGRGRPPDWLIVDHYGIDSRWETAVRSTAGQLLAIDDLADRKHDIDVLVDAAHDESAAALYRYLVSEKTRLLFGPRFALLRREFFTQPQVPRADAPVRRMLVTFGGNDPLNMTGLALHALEAPEFDSIAIDVTVGLSNVRLQEIQQQAKRLANVTIHVQHPRPSILMEQADLCLGAGGTTTWERCYLGLPSLIVVLADNQRAFAETVDRLGVVRSLGSGEKLTAEDLQKAIRSAIQDQGWRVNSSRAGQMLVDGRGIERVIRILEDGERRLGA